MKLSKYIFILFLVFAVSGCFSFGSVHVRNEATEISATYIRFGDQNIKDFYIQSGNFSAGFDRQYSNSSYELLNLIKSGL